jgi:hypothetical protein
MLAFESASDRDPSEHTTFLLSPAHAGGRRARVLLNEDADFPLARSIRGVRGAPVGEVFSFLSGLYFRGKLSYAARFGRPGDGIQVITTDRGLLPIDTPITADDLRSFSELAIDIRDQRYRESLERDLRLLPDTRIVFLGSIATRKYLGILFDILGDRLFYPAAFVGLGDMSRGAMLLDAVRTGTELEYLPASKLPSEVRRGHRHA